MKKNLLLLSFFLLNAAAAFSQQRYIDEVFNNVTVTSNVEYGQNYSVLTGSPTLQSLVMDVYQPAGDTLTARPLVIYMHASDFLPIILTGSPVGDMHDSCAAEMCRQLARRGFVAVSMDYRIGWNPISFDQDIRTGTLLQAVYRGVQDARSCVRYFRSNAANAGNTFKIDTGCITIGGEGSLGYVATACASLNHYYPELTLLKFISATTGQPYIDTTIIGNLEGFGGTPGVNNDNWPGYSSNVSMVFNLEGALADSSWLEGGEVPMVAFHDTNNPGSPYHNGPVIGPTGFVIWVTGSYDMIRRADSLGNNNVFNVAWNDPYTTRADQVNNGWEGLFPIVQVNPQLIIPGDPYDGQENPWQWWDSLDLQTVAPFYGATSAQATAAYLNGKFTNPDMSKVKALKYIDTVLGYLTPRIVQNCQLPGFISGVDEVNLFNEDVQLFPNPATEYFTLQLQDPSQKIKEITVYDATGRIMKKIEDINSNQVQLSRGDLLNGLYLVKVRLKDRELNGKLILQ